LNRVIRARLAARGSNSLVQAIIAETASPAAIEVAGTALASPDTLTRGTGIRRRPRSPRRRGWLKELFSARLALRQAGDGLDRSRELDVDRPRSAGSRTSGCRPGASSSAICGGSRAEATRHRPPASLGPGRALGRAAQVAASAVRVQPAVEQPGDSRHHEPGHDWDGHGCGDGQPGDEREPAEQWSEDHHHERDQGEDRDPRE
jgi:hypothetical protein